MRILRAAERRPAPWKNGGGETFEVFAWPAGAGLAAFDWRISLARIAASGPFSHFPGVWRLTAMLEGEMRLKVAGQADAVLTVSSPAMSYPGDVETYGELIGPEGLDLNVMTRTGACDARLRRLSGPQALRRAPGVAWMALIALGDVSLRQASDTDTLRRLDAAVWDDDGAVEVEGPRAFWLAEILTL